ncbi:MAG: hypothetical protein HFF00_05355 [Ruminiclostridium sp.]|jgi:hypothetical protein|nr:hypothetical protein [Ruminiclostridium sp.]
MKKRLTALSCTLALLLTMMVVPAWAGESFFLSINDTLPPASTQTTPIQYGGWIYVPMGAFNSRVTGVNLGVYCGLTDGDQSLVFYDLSGRNMTFNLADGTATAEGSAAPVPSTIVARNGTYYAPAYAVCQYFGLSYSFYNTDYGPLLRIKDGNAVLSDSLFISSATSLMRGRSGGSGGNGGTTYTNPTVPVTPEPPAPDPDVVIPPREEEPPSFSMYLGVQAGAGGDISGALNALAGAKAAAVVFFPTENLTENTAQIRQAAARGHKVGLIPQGENAKQRLESVKQGSRLLAQILRQETWFVLGNDQTLTEAGYLCWSPGLTLTASNAASLYNSVVDHANGRSSAGRVLLKGGTSSAVLSAALNQLASDGDTFLVPRETRY